MDSIDFTKGWIEPLFEMRSAGLRCETIHRDKSLEERINIISSLNNGMLDVIIGVNMLKDGVQKPAFSLVVVVDTDMETLFYPFDDFLFNCKEAAKIKGEIDAINGLSFKN